MILFIYMHIFILILIYIHMFMTIAHWIYKRIKNSWWGVYDGVNLQKKFTPSFHITNLIISAKRTVGLNLCLFYNLCFPLYSQNIRSFQNVRMPYLFKLALIIQNHFCLWWDLTGCTHKTYNYLHKKKNLEKTDEEKF